MTKTHCDRCDIPMGNQHTTGGPSICFRVAPSPIGIELTPTAQPLTTFTHPRDAVYVFGPEDGHISQAWRALCHQIVFIPSYHCLNLTAAMNVVLADRMMKAQLTGQVPILSAGDMLKENRGVQEIESVPGWDGK